MTQEYLNKAYIIGYGSDINNFIEIALYKNENVAIKELHRMKRILPEFHVLDYRIEIFDIKKNNYIHSGKTIRLHHS